MIRWKIFRNKKECSDEKLHSSSSFIRKMDVLAKKLYHEEMFDGSEMLDSIWECLLDGMEFSDTITTENILYNEVYCLQTRILIKNDEMDN